LTRPRTFAQGKDLTFKAKDSKFVLEDISRKAKDQGQGQQHWLKWQQSPLQWNNTIVVNPGDIYAQIGLTGFIAYSKHKIQGLSRT